ERQGRQRGQRKRAVKHTQDCMRASVQSYVELVAAADMPRYNYLVFTSAGDRANCRHWLRGRRNFDLWITYYGDVPGTWAEIADLYNCRQGSKFQNLHSAYCSWGERLRHYEAIMVLDDDILISGEDLSHLFELRHTLDLWVLQPAFHPRGKISW